MTPELKVPFIADSDIERATQELLRKYSARKGAAVPPERSTHDRAKEHRAHIPNPDSRIPNPDSR